METQQICQITTVKPTVENVISITQYKKTQPRTLWGINETVDHNQLLHMDQSILYGGGRDLILGLVNNQEQQNLENVALFILNSCIILWFDILGHGLQIPYTSVLYHGIRNNGSRLEGHSLECILTLERDEILNQFFPNNATAVAQNDPNVIDTVELYIYPKYGANERHYNNEIEELFTFSNFGMNRGDDMITNCNEALKIGMELHLDDFRHDSTTNDNDINANFVSMNDFIHQTNAFYNNGHADDLDNDSVINHIVNNNNAEAGMSLRFQAGHKLAGRKNPRR